MKFTQRIKTLHNAMRTLFLSVALWVSLYFIVQWQSNECCGTHLYLAATNVIVGVLSVVLLFIAFVNFVEYYD
jgi:hypothetical protein